jgi:hypothetical protein
MSDPGDTFTEVTSRSWISRIGQSIVGVLIGLVMVIASIVVLFWNEGRAIQTARSLAEGAGLVVDVDSARVDPGNEGKLVHISGDLTAPGRLSDAEFGGTAKGLRLVRAVEMDQWKEETKTETHQKLGGGEEDITTYTYLRVGGVSGRIATSQIACKSPILLIKHLSVGSMGFHGVPSKIFPWSSQDEIYVQDGCCSWAAGGAVGGHLL